MLSHEKRNEYRITRPATSRRVGLPPEPAPVRSIRSSPPDTARRSSPARGEAGTTPFPRRSTNQSPFWRLIKLHEVERLTNDAIPANHARPRSRDLFGTAVLFEKLFLLD